MPSRAFWCCAEPGQAELGSAELPVCRARQCCAVLCYAGPGLAGLGAECWAESSRAGLWAGLQEETSITWFESASKQHKAKRMNFEPNRKFLNIKFICNYNQVPQHRAICHHQIPSPFPMHRSCKCAVGRRHSPCAANTAWRKRIRCGTLSQAAGAANIPLPALPLNLPHGLNMFKYCDMYGIEQNCFFTVKLVETS